MSTILIVLFFICIGLFANKKAQEIAQENKREKSIPKEKNISENENGVQDFRTLQFRMFLVFIGIVIVIIPFASALLGGNDSRDKYHDEGPIDPDKIEVIFGE